MKVEEFIHCFSSAGESWVTFLESRILHNVYTTALGKQMLPWTFPIPLLPTIFCCPVQRHMVQGNAFSYLRPGVLAISLLNLLPIPSLLTLGWEGGRKPWHCISAAHQVPKCISNTVLDINAKHGTFGAAVKKLNVLTPSQLDPLPAAGPNTSCHTTKWRVCRSSHPCKSMDYDQGTVSGAEYQLQCVENSNDSVGILQSLCQIVPINAHTGTERTLYASLLGSIEQIRGWKRQYPGLHCYQWQDMISPLWAGIKMAVHGVVTHEFTVKEKVQVKAFSGWSDMDCLLG